MWNRLGSHDFAAARSERSCRMGGCAFAGFVALRCERWVWVRWLDRGEDGGGDPRGTAGSLLDCFFPSLGHDPASALIENYFLAEFLLSTVVK